MTKQEFETMTGKQVTFETFEKYNAMYSALPDDVDKFQFVEMLNVKVIPEDPEIIQLRKGNEALRKQIEERCELIKSRIEFERLWTENYKNSRYYRMLQSELKSLKQLLRLSH